MSSKSRGARRAEKPARLAENSGRSGGAFRRGERSTPDPERTPLLWALLVCFTLSGMTGLIYQVLWGRMLALVFGATTAATGTVLAVFMGGLALGGWWAGRRADRTPNPLRTYGLLEGGIGLCALLVPVLFAAAIPLYGLGWRMTGGAGAVLFGLRFVLACLALLLPTTLMGATLPLLSRLCATRLSALGAQVGALYGANTVGAAVGAFLAGFLLIPALGVTGTLWATAGINFALMGAALALDRLFSAQQLPVVEPAMLVPESLGQAQARGKRPAPLLPVEAVVAVPATPERVARMALLGFGVSGALALVYEVAWTRALVLVIGSNVNAFAAMLSTFLIGLFLGTLVMARFADRLRQPLVALAWAEVGVGVAAWGAYLAFDSLPWLSLNLLHLWPRTATYALLTRFLLAASMLFPTALFLGALFPLVVRAVEPALSRVGRTVGDLYASNTVGALVGALAASFLLIPNLGTQVTLLAMVVANVLLGALFYRLSLPAKSAAKNARPTWAPVVVLPLIALLVVGFSPHWDMVALLMVQPTRRVLATYLKRVGKMPYETQADYVADAHLQHKLLFHKEGVSSDVAVIHSLDATGLYVRGHGDASDGVDMPTQILLGAIPMLVHSALPSPAQVAVVGWGSGVTGGVIEQFPLQRLTAIELEPEVLRAADFFRSVNHDSLRDPRLTVLREDGRNVFLASETAYDLIISEPSNVWQAGVCNLFTTDFFRLCRARLKPGGLFAQWFAYGAVPTPEVRGILAAVRQVFPQALLFRVSDVDAVLIASTHPVRVDVAKVEAKLRTANSTLLADLQRAGVPDAAHLAAHLLLGSNELAAFCQHETPNTDDNARLEFAVARAYEMQSYAEEAQRAFTAVAPPTPLPYLDLSGLSAHDRAAFLSQLSAARTETAGSDP